MQLFNDDCLKVLPNILEVFLRHVKGANWKYLEIL